MSEKQNNAFLDVRKIRKVVLRSEKSEIRSEKSEDRNQKSEIRSDDGNQFMLPVFNFHIIFLTSYFSVLSSVF